MRHDDDEHNHGHGGPRPFRAARFARPSAEQPLGRADLGFGPGHGHRRGGRPPFAGGGRARRGDIRAALLLSLGDGPGHGYELIGRLEARSGGAWRPSAGSVYPTLQLLADEGLVTSRDEDGRRVFELTEEGRRAAEEAAERMSEGPFAGEWSSGHAELRQAMKSLVGAVRQTASVGEEAQIAAATAVVTEARQRLYGILAASPSGPSEAAAAEQHGE